MSVVISKALVVKGESVLVRVCEHGKDLLLQAIANSQNKGGRYSVLFTGAKAYWSPPQQRWVLVQWTRGDAEVFDNPITLLQALAGAQL